MAPFPQYFFGPLSGHLPAVVLQSQAKVLLSQLTGGWCGDPPLPPPAWEPEVIPEVCRPMRGSDLSQLHLSCGDGGGWSPERSPERREQQGVGSLWGGLDGAPEATWSCYRLPSLVLTPPHQGFPPMQSSIKLALEVNCD